MVEKLLPLHESSPTWRTLGPAPDSNEEKLHRHPNSLSRQVCPLPVLSAIGDHPPWRQRLCCLEGHLLVSSIKVLNPSTWWVVGYPPSQWPGECPGLAESDRCWLQCIFLPQIRGKLIPNCFLQMLAAHKDVHSKWGNVPRGWLWEFQVYAKLRTRPSPPPPPPGLSRAMSVNPRTESISWAGHITKH